MQNPFRYSNSSPEVIRLAVMMYMRYPLSLRQVEDILIERGIDICHVTVRWPGSGKSRPSRKLPPPMLRITTISIKTILSVAVISSSYIDQFL